MFIQVPESVSKSLRNGIAPRTQIHFPKASLENRDPRAILVDNGIHRLRNEMFASRECSCGADGVTMAVGGPNWIMWRPPMLPSHESYRRSREVCNNLLLTPCSSPSRQSVTGVTELQTQNAVAREEVETPAKEDDHSEEDEIESLESPRSFASSGSNSSRDDMVIQFPELQSSAGRHTPVPKPRSQQSNPWGRASYSDLITMAITSTGNNMMTLSEIYGWIVKNVPYFNDKGTYLSVQGWKNAVRHTLSLRKRFVRIPDPKRPYKSMWTVSDDYQRSHLKQKRSHLKSQREKVEIKQEMRQRMDVDGAMH